MKHTVGIAERLIVPEPQDAIAQRLEERGAPRVVVGAHCMLTAVQLHDQLPLTATGVDDVGADRHLAREFDAEETAIAEMSPQPALRVRLSPPQPTREISR